MEPTVSLSAFAYLFSEMVQYHQNRVDSISELERRLESTGFSVGLRVLELLAYRSREFKRETKLMNVLQFVSTVVWKSLFSKPADSLERSIDHADEFMIVDYAPITRYVFEKRMRVAFFCALSCSQLYVSLDLNLCLRNKSPPNCGMR